jgi:acyl-coenzyme A synthetase/AMP-(fatty) acid ligase
MFDGRRDDQIKHLGYRIELGEIEHAVMSIANVANACVLYDAEGKEIVLFFESGETLTDGYIRAELARTLPKYMLPTVFYQLDELPRNPNGKIDRHGLRIRYLGRNRPRSAEVERP